VAENSLIPEEKQVDLQQDPEKSPTVSEVVADTAMTPMISPLSADDTPNPAIYLEEIGLHTTIGPQAPTISAEPRCAPARTMVSAAYTPTWFPEAKALTETMKEVAGSLVMMEKVTTALEEGTKVQKDIARQLIKQNELKTQELGELKAQNQMRRDGLEELRIQNKLKQAELEELKAHHQRDRSRSDVRGMDDTVGRHHAREDRSPQESYQGRGRDKSYESRGRPISFNNPAWHAKR
jgi:hypothetical protein